MMKWLKSKQTLLTETQTQSNKRRLTRKERYMKKYLNNDKVYQLWVDLTEAKLIPRPDNSQFEQSIYYLPGMSLGQKLKLTNLSFTQESMALNVGQQQQLIDLISGEFKPQLTKSPVLAVFSVMFHHKKGSQIEYSYPSLDKLSGLFETPHHFEDVLSRITTYALPDAVHNLNEDYMYFTIQTSLREIGRQLMFGVTYFKQIKVTEMMRQNDPELTRSHIQKAICMISLEPLFGYIKKRLEPTIRAYFSLEEFHDMSLIQFAYQNIEQALDYEKSLGRLEISEIYAGLNVRGLFFVFKERVFKILKAIMLEMRIIVFSLSSSTCSDFIVSLLSLIPGTLFFQLRNKMVQSQQCYFNEFGLPFRIFCDKVPFHLYFTVNDLPEIIDVKPMPKGYLIGTTNKFIRGLNKLQPDMIIDIDAEQLIIEKEAHKKILKTKPYDKQLFDIINESSLKHLEPAQKELLKLFRPVPEADTIYQGSEDWIRSQIHRYFFSLLSEIGYLYLNMNEFDKELTKVSEVQTRKSILLKQQNYKNFEEEKSDNSGDEEEKNQTPVPEELLQKSREDLLKEHKIRETRVRINETFKIIMKCNRKFAYEWLLNTNNGRQWAIAHQQSIALNAKHYEDELKDQPFVISYENGDIYIGKALKNGVKQKNGILFEFSKNKVYVGEFLNNMKHGKGKYESLLSKEQCYSGDFVNNLMCGHGRLVVQDQFQYNGYFENDKFNGFGNIQYKDEIYEGQFVDGIYQGTGKLIMNTQDVYVGFFNNGLFEGEGQYVWKQGDIYKGYFRQGLRHGMGRIQFDQNLYFHRVGVEEEQVYEGEWEQGKKCGYGCLTKLDSNLKYQGNFQNDELDTTENVIVKYPNDSVYQGMVKNWLPNGPGYMATKDGQSTEGIFKDGILYTEKNSET